MNKAEYYMDVLTPEALDKMLVLHGEGEIEISNAPYFSQPDDSRRKMIHAFKEANEGVIQDLKQQLEEAHYEYMAIASLKGLVNNLSRTTEEDVDYADEEFGRADGKIKTLMEQYTHALHARRELEHWFL